MDKLVASIRAKKARLDAPRPMSEAPLRQPQKYYVVALTYTSKAIEGNTLTHGETAEVIEHGITVGGKTLKEHREAVDQLAPVLWMRERAAEAARSRPPPRRRKRSMRIFG